MAEFWLRCTECKSEIAFGAKYYQCSVSTCNRSKLRLVFCSIVCWDSHLGEARHREAWAEEARAPTREAWQRELAAAEPARPAAPQASSASPPRQAPAPSPSGGGGSSSSAAAAAAAPPRPAGPAPSAAPAPSASPGSAPIRRVVGDASQATAAAVEGVKLTEVTDRDILIVVSKMKKYIKDRSGMNCSDAVADMLSEHVRLLCDEAIRAAARDERKTVLDRDVTRVRR
jgi:histone H3/H4